MREYGTVFIGIDDAYPGFYEMKELVLEFINIFKNVNNNDNDNDSDNDSESEIDSDSDSDSDYYRDNIINLLIIF